MARNIDIFIRLKAFGDQVIKKLNSNLNKTRLELDALRQASGALLEAGTQITALGASLTAASAVPIAVAANFESAISGVEALVKGSIESSEELEETMLKLKAQAEELGETTQFSATQAAEGMQFLARAGFKAQQIMEAMPSVLNLAAVEGLELAQAADIASNILTGFKLPVSEFKRVVDNLANTTSNANVNLIQLGEALKTAGPVASSAGIAFEDVAAAAGALGNAGLQGTVAGTALRAIIRSLINPSGEAKDIIEELGIQIIDSSGNFVGFANVVEQFEKALGDVGGEAQRTSLLMKIFGERGGPGFAALLGQGSDALVEMQGIVKRTGTASDIAKTRLDNLQGSITELRSAVEGLLITMGDPLLDIVRGLVEGLTFATRSAKSFFKELGPVGPIILGIAGSIGALLAVLGVFIGLLGASGLAITGVITGLTTLSTIIPILTVKIGVLGAVVNTAFGKFLLVITAIAAAWKIGDMISQIELFGVKIEDFVGASVLELRKWINFVELGFLKFKRFSKAVLGFDTSELDLAIDEQQEFIEVLDQAQARLLRRKELAEDLRRVEENLSRTREKLIDQEEELFNDDELQETVDDLPEFIKQRERDLTEFVELAKTKLAELQAQQRRGSLDLQTFLLARQRLLEETTNQEIELLNLRLEAEQDANKRGEIKLQILRKEQELKRQLIELSFEQGRAEEQVLRDREEVERRLREIERRALGESIEDSKRRNALEIQELETKHQKELSLLAERGAFQEELGAAQAAQQREIANLRLSQAEKIKDAQRQIVDTLSELENQTAGDNFAELKKRLDNELQELEKSNQEKIALLRRLGAEEQEVERAKNLALESENQKRINNETKLNEELQKIRDERIAASNREQERLQEIDTRLLDLKVSANPDDLQTQFDLELQLLDQKHQSQIGKLIELNATADQLQQARHLQELERERVQSQQILAVWENRLAAAGQIAGGLAQIFNEFFEATGKRNKAFFIASKAAAIAQATINTAQGITKALAEGGPILGPIQAGIIAALGGIQIGKIAAQKLAEGGPVVGGSGVSDDVMIGPGVLAMGGEYVIKKSSVNYYGHGIMEGINRQMIPRGAIASLAGNMPSAHVPSRLRFAAGGPVPSNLSKSNSGGNGAAQPISIVNFTNPNNMDSYFASSAGQEVLLNVISDNAEGITQILARRG